MQVFTSTEQVPSNFGPAAVAIGKFDGVHAGHRRVIAQLELEASARSLVPAVVTFDRNPLSVLRPELSPEALLSNGQKIDRLAETGLAAALVVTFDEEFSRQAPERFVREILVDALHARLVMVGADFRFGAQGAGTVETLRQLGTQWGFEVVLVDDVVLDVTHDGGHRVSSTWIRTLLAEGRPREAATLLGHLAGIRSNVVHGHARGRDLGYPTANLAHGAEGFIPADGVYAAWLSIDGNRYGAAVSIGNNPTFEGVHDKTVEAHVLDEKLDLYDKVVDLEFVEYMRPMEKFAGATELVAQMELDEERIRDVLGYPAKSR